MVDGIVSSLRLDFSRGSLRPTSKLSRDRSTQSWNTRLRGQTLHWLRSANESKDSWIDLHSNRCSSRLQTNLPVFRVKECTVRRRYSDFEWLRKELERDSKVGWISLLFHSDSHSLDRCAPVAVESMEAANAGFSPPRWRDLRRWIHRWTTQRIRAIHQQVGEHRRRERSWSLSVDLEWLGIRWPRTNVRCTSFFKKQPSIMTNTCPVKCAILKDALRSMEY